MVITNAQAGIILMCLVAHLLLADERVSLLPLELLLKLPDSSVMVERLKGQLSGWVLFFS